MIQPSGGRGSSEVVLVTPFCFVAEVIVETASCTRMTNLKGLTELATSSSVIGPPAWIHRTVRCRRPREDREYQRHSRYLCPISADLGFSNRNKPQGTGRLTVHEGAAERTVTRNEPQRWSLKLMAVKSARRLGPAGKSGSDWS
jgi:hypothetical protein